MDKKSYIGRQYIPCPRCAISAWHVVAIGPAKEYWECESCGHEETFLLGLEQYVGVML